MFESNFPVDKGMCSHSEKAAPFRRTAATTYRMALTR